MADPVLTTDERNWLAYEIVAKLSQFADFGIQGKREFVVAAGLEKFLTGIVWANADRTVAGSLVDKLNKHGILPERPEYHAVGALIAYLLKDTEISADDKQNMADLVVRKYLIHDPNYIEGLRNDYSITDESVPEVEQSQATYKGDLDKNIKEPAFKPIVQNKEALERARTSEDNFLDTYQLLGAIYSAEAVGRVELSLDEPLGTGWLIGPDLLLTNKHVLPTPEYVAEVKIHFGYRRDSLGVALEGPKFRLDPDFYYWSPVEELDYALVRLTERPLAHMKIDGDIEAVSLFELIRQGKHRGYLRPVPTIITNLQRVNIIQHPGKSPQKVVLTQNYVTDDMHSNRVHYQTNTKPGSSGSPVFNLQWDVVALHHSGKSEPPISGVENVNEGIPMKAILRDFDDKETNQGRPLRSLLPRVK